MSCTYYKLRFQRYIVGRPNLLTLQIKLVGRHLNELISDLDFELAQLYNEVDVWVTTDDYPPIIELDCRMVSHKKPFKFLDLIKLLPEGMWLHRKYDSLMYQSIVTLGENYNLLLSSNNFPVVDPDDPEGEKIGFTQEEIMANTKSINPELRAQFLNQYPSIDLADESYIKEFMKKSLDINDEELEKLNIQKELTEQLGKEVDTSLNNEEDEIGIEEAEEDGDGDGEENNLNESMNMMSEEKIKEIINDLNKRKVAPKGAIVPLSAASSKKLMQNKFETNSTAKFKKAQAKGSTSGGKKDAKPKK